MTIPLLVGHRGYPRYYPENTLCGLEAVLPGGCFVEVDIQFTADMVPVVIHDTSLARTGGVAGDVRDMDYAGLKEVVVDERRRLGRPFPQARVPCLAQAADWVARNPPVKAFIEVKAESMERFGRRPVVERILQDLEPVRDRVVVISFDTAALELVRSLSALPVGWVLDGWGDSALAHAARLAPEFLFCDYTAIPGDVLELPRGVWQWVLYDIVDPQLALEWARRGADLIETAAIGDLLAHPVLSRRACGG